MALLIETDDILCNLNSGIAELLQISDQEIKYNAKGEITTISQKEADELLSAQPASFWESLEATPECEAFQQFLSAYSEEVRLITRPYNTTASTQGKEAWVKRHFPEITLVFTRSKHVFSTPQTLLLDTKPGIIQAFKRYGGKGVLFPKPWQKAYKQVEIETVLGSLVV